MKNTVSTAKLDNELHQLHSELKGIYLKYCNLIQEHCALVS